MFNASILTIGFLRKRRKKKKKTLLSLTLIILSVYSLASCKEYSIAGTYSEEPPSPEYESRIRIRINTDNSIESFFDGEWHNNGIAKVNKKNKNFMKYNIYTNIEKFKCNKERKNAIIQFK